MAKIKGIWVFNEKFADGEFNFTVTGISFTSYINMEFDGINPSGGLSSSGGYKSVMYYKRKGVQVWDVIAQSSYHGYANGWQNDAFRTVDFGETEQTVPDDFYAWMQKNAVQQTVRTVKGKWTFNEKLNNVHDVLSNQITVEFTIQNYTLDENTYYPKFYAFSFDMIDFIEDRLCYILARKSDGGYVQYNAYTEGVWSTAGGNPANKIDFGEEEQTVPEEFYNWFIANATQQAEPEEPTIGGKKFTRLHLGDAVYSAGGKMFRKLSTEEPQETIVGTWLFDKGDINFDLFVAAAGGQKYIPLLYSASNQSITPILGNIYSSAYRKVIHYKYSYASYALRFGVELNGVYIACANEDGTSQGTSTLQTFGLSSLKGKTWTFYDTCNDPDIVYHPVLLEWLKTFATKVS